MNTVNRNSQPRGYTLIELLIALAVLAVLSSMAVPHMLGFLRRGTQDAWNNDRLELEMAVDSWRTNTTKRSGDVWPILAGGTGSDCLQDVPNTTPPCNTYIDIGALAAEGYFKSASVVASADTSKNTTATNSRPGHYGWFINSQGRVASDPPYTDSLYP